MDQEITEMSLEELLSWVIHGKWIILGAMVAGLALAGFYGIQLPALV